MENQDSVSREAIKVKVELSREELFLLDGKVSPEIQSVINNLKEVSQYKDKFAKLLADILEEARTSGIIVANHKQISYCRYCGAHGSYLKYKSGRYKNQYNYKKPTYINGIEFAKRFLTVANHATIGCCLNCYNEVKDDITNLLKNENCQTPWNGKKKVDVVKCGNCNYECPEDEYRKKLTLFGDGYYPAACPLCGQERKCFTDKFIIRSSTQA